jgi:hypothetical protein
MLRRDRLYLFGNCCLGAAIANIVINAFLGWATFRGLGVPALPLWRIPGVVADLAGTAFGVTFGTCLGMGWQIRRDLRRGKIGHFGVSSAVASFVARFPHGTLKRSVGLGVVSIPIFALPVVAVLVLLGAESMDRIPYVTLKAGLAAVEAAIVTPFLVVAALADERPLARRPRGAHVPSES